MARHIWSIQHLSGLSLIPQVFPLQCHILHTCMSFHAGHSVCLRNFLPNRTLAEPHLNVMKFLSRLHQMLHFPVLVMVLFLITMAFTSLGLVKRTHKHNLPQPRHNDHLPVSPRNSSESKSLPVKLSVALKKHQPDASTVQWCNAPLTLLHKPGPEVALASFPGSGNTWVRYLLQQATGNDNLFFSHQHRTDCNPSKLIEKIQERQ